MGRSDVPMCCYMNIADKTTAPDKNAHKGLRKRYVLLSNIETKVKDVDNNGRQMLWILVQQQNNDNIYYRSKET